MPGGPAHAALSYYALLISTLFLLTFGEIMVFSVQSVTIAAGGGIVTQPDNLAPMRQNSTVIFLKRDASLLPVEGRPVSQANNLQELYRRRLPLYEAACDLEVENHRVEDTVKEIIRRLSL